MPGNRAGFITIVDFQWFEWDYDLGFRRFRALKSPIRQPEGVGEFFRYKNLKIKDSYGDF
jgi:hypothetical protein